MVYLITVDFLGVTTSEEVYHGDFTNLCFHIASYYDLTNINYHITIDCIDSNEEQ